MLNNCRNLVELLPLKSRGFKMLTLENHALYLQTVYNKPQTFLPFYKA